MGLAVPKRFEASDLGHARDERKEPERLSNPDGVRRRAKSVPHPPAWSGQYVCRAHVESGVLHRVTSGKPDSDRVAGPSGLAEQEPLHTLIQDRQRNDPFALCQVQAHRGGQADDAEW